MKKILISLLLTSLVLVYINAEDQDESEKVDTSALEAEVKQLEQDIYTKEQQIADLSKEVHHKKIEHIKKVSDLEGKSGRVYKSGIRKPRRKTQKRRTNTRNRYNATRKRTQSR